MPRLTPALLLAAAAVPVLALAGCSTASEPTTEADGILIVASTDVYADIAASIGGDLVTTQAIISGAAADPHSYEATARDQLAIADADLVILNGGGYDPFMETLIEASGSTAPVISAVEASGLLDDDHAHDEGDEHAEEEHAEEEHAEDGADHEGHDHIEGFNEHVWYDVHGMAHLAEEIAHELAELDPANAEAYEAGEAEFVAGIEVLEARIAELEPRFHELDALVTEPVPGYLLAALGFHDVTPSAFSEAVEEGSEISVAVLDETLGLAEGGTIALLAVNAQTGSAETERVQTAVEGAGVPVVAFTETLPEGQDYLSWMAENIEAAASAVA